ncbi:5-aminolevulinate synthase [Dongshaea marina]|uniref:5-aminolevulinate synthase n=1 Tax=Dongshaea marina TaxID=2047966 RepID=UPI000D3ED7BE|nr:5-aminolevulinate synthase [Dongshaea marina]
MNKYDSYIRMVEQLNSKHQIRDYLEIDQSQGCFPYIRVNNRECISFSTCNYLGYTEHESIKQSAIDGTLDFGVGTGGSRYIGGTSSIHHKVENKIAQLHNKESAVLYNNGYMANLGTIPCLAREGDIIFSDEKNHASIIDAIRLSKAKRVIWKHNDPRDLEQKILQNPCEGNRLIICESLYSMDGDFAPLREIVELCKKHQCLLYLDEIHAIGVYGHNGAGYASQLGLENDVDFLMGGTAKALGSLGGYVCLPRCVEQLIKSRSRSFIFTISLPNLILNTISTAVDICQSDQLSRATLQENSDYMREKLEHYGYDYLNSQSHLFPIMIGESGEAKKATALFLREGIYVQGVQFPTVPEGEARLRVSVTATHSKAQIDFFISVLNQLREQKAVKFSGHCALTYS